MLKPTLCFWWETSCSAVEKCRFCPWLLLPQASAYREEKKKKKFKSLYSPICVLMENPTNFMHWYSTSAAFSLIKPHWSNVFNLATSLQKVDRPEWSKKKQKCTEKTERFSLKSEVLTFSWCKQEISKLFSKGVLEMARNNGFKL